MPVDPELAELLRSSADRSVAAVDRLRDGMVTRAEFDALKAEVATIDGKTSALVDSRPGIDGEEEIVYLARPTRLDVRTLVSLVIAFLAALSPIVVALLTR